ncbi:MAG: MFS transporter [Alphaproteobacteria bacterium]|nr:MFS transporter [Alphaproteobacteria bacterium]
MSPDAHASAVAAPASLARDVSVISLVGVAHATSHVFQMCLPPMFPLLRDEFGISFGALGMVVAAFYVASGIGQAFVGILVDRWGGRPVLACGMALLAFCIGLMALAPSFWMLYPLAVMAGLGNCVFHPADFSMLAHRVDRSRHGRAFSVHAFGGTLGFAASPILLSAIAFAIGWREALLLASAWGLAMAAAVWLAGDLLGRGPAAADARRESPREIASGFLKLVTMPALLVAFVYLTMTATAGGGLQTYGAVALSALHDLQFQLATAVISAYLIGNAGGILLGGPLADMTDRHGLIAGVGLVLAGALVALASFPGLTQFQVMALFSVGGVCVGVTAASRDVLVKKVAPKGSLGRTFGLVYSGFDIGSMLGPLALGWFMDHGMPQGVILGVAAVFVLTTVAIRLVSRRAEANA